MSDVPDINEAIALYYSSAEEFERLQREKMAECSPEQWRLLSVWLGLGRQNFWIQYAVDPPFTELSFYLCADIRVLVEKLLHGNWCLGQAFALGDICFINQINGGDEWLTIKGSTAFESITMQSYGESREHSESRLRETVDQIRRATEIQCQRLEYEDDYEVATPEDGEIALEDGEVGNPILVLKAHLRFSDGREELRRYSLRVRPGDIAVVLKNGISRFVLSSNASGDILLEYLRYGPSATGIALVAASDISEQLGQDFHEQDAVEQLLRLLPHIRSAREEQETHEA